MADRPPAAGGAIAPKVLPPAPHRLLAELQPVFEDLGLNGYQARVLLALLQAGSATAVQLAHVTDVPRTSVYPVLRELHARRLVSKLAGKSSVWVSPGRAEVLDALHADQAQRFEELGEKVAQARALLADVAPEPQEPALPDIHILDSASQSRLAFEQAVTVTHSELLMCVRRATSTPGGKPSPAVQDMLRRGVTCRILYERSDIVGPAGSSWLGSLDECEHAGSSARVVDDLPMTLAIFDGEVVLLALSNPVQPEVGFATSLLVEHAAFVALQVRAFEDLWTAGEPFPSFVERLTSIGHSIGALRDPA